MGFESTASTGGRFTSNSAPPSAAGLDLGPTGGMDGSSFSVKTLCCPVALSSFLSSTRRWIECRGTSLFWLRTILLLGLEVGPPPGLRLCRCLMTLRSSCSMAARVKPASTAVVVSAEALGPESGGENLSLGDEPGGDGL